MNSSNHERFSLETELLLLRPWKATDYDSFVQMNADHEVMRYFPNPLSPLQSVEFARHLSEEISEQGWGMWVVELKATSEFVGMLGLQSRKSEEGILEHDFVEIAWRFNKAFWGQGLAPQAANRVIKFAFEELRLEAVYSFTALCNLPSQRVMQKVGMRDIKQPFQHPKLAPDSPLSWHCLYQITYIDWQR
ncbi:GNAT family N-acetyltransferase [Vibrio gallicus]|uniref:GNAT family N-acetyltransferase n=1 Tax=Vibrio gallicus TaxID=190897 RepID=UPI0021C3680F|nr:GNAT family N-acetyltransferase [Vibrio gallicus]